MAVLVFLYVRFRLCMDELAKHSFGHITLFILLLINYKKFLTETKISVIFPLFN